MPPANKLYWDRMQQSIMVDWRALTDGRRTLAILMLTEGIVTEGEGRFGYPAWLYTWTPIRLKTETGRVLRERYRTLALDDGHGKILAKLALPDPDAWEKVLRNSLIPPFVEGDRRIEFPRLPDAPYYPQRQ
jgi:hypothetical protein